MSGTGSQHEGRVDERTSIDGVRRLERRVPRSAGLAGIVFSVLFVASLLMASVRPAEGLDEQGFLDWFKTQGITLTTISALYLAPFAGIAFLWFIGVIRSRIGSSEDQFFGTVFLGSGLLFVTMCWAAAAELASLVAGNRYDAAPPLGIARLEDTRSVAFAFLFVLAARAAAVFMLVTCTIARRTGIFPRPLILAGYGIALVMLLSLAFLQWIVLLFPVWVCVASVYILIADRASGLQAAARQ
jgi:hypothetical protein